MVTLYVLCIYVTATHRLVKIKDLLEGEGALKTALARPLPQHVGLQLGQRFQLYSTRAATQFISWQVFVNYSVGF